MTFPIWLTETLKPLLDNSKTILHVLDVSDLKFHPCPDCEHGHTR